MTFSVVSHAQERLVDQLCRSLVALSEGSAKIILTRNIPEDSPGTTDLVLNGSISLIENSVPRGFGANHNHAFDLCNTEFFCVVNPDIYIESLDLEALISCLSDSNIAIVAPLVLNQDRSVSDHARKHINVQRLVARILVGNGALDYPHPGRLQTIDWCAGMFMLVRSTVFGEVGGFDERYFMYLEDADLCARLRVRGFKVARTGLVSVIHEAQRESRRSTQHLRWHITSMIRYLAKWQFASLKYAHSV